MDADDYDIQVIDSTETALLLIVPHPDDDGTSRVVIRGTLAREHVPCMLRSIADHVESSIAGEN